MRRILVLTLVFCLTGTPLFGQTLQSSIDRAVATESSARQGGGRGPIRPAYLWTGVGLLSAGGVYLGIGAAADDDYFCAGNSCYYVTRKALLGVGAGLLAAGGVLLIIGNAKRSSSPQIVTGPGRIWVKQTVKF